MKTLINILVIFVVLTGFVFGQQQPVGQWTFEEGVGDTTADVSGNGSTGTLLGGVFWDDDTPLGVGKSLYFDGSTGLIDLGDPDALYLVDTDVTLMAWIKPDSVGGPQSSGNVNIIAKGHYSGSGSGDPLRGEIILRINSPSYTGNSNYQSGSWGQDGAANCTCIMPVEDWQNWVHLAATYSVDSSLWRIYRNGHCDSTTTATRGLMEIGAPWCIGARGDFGFANQRFFRGNIDDARIYDVPLSPAEIKDIYEGNEVKVAQKDMDFTLASNYPNPFNPSTTIQYALNKPNQVTLNIYNIQGELVQSVFNHVPQTAGVQHVTVDMSNQPSGIYFYTVEIGNQIQSGKMTLMK